MDNRDKQEAIAKVEGLQSEVGAYDRHWDISYVNQSHYQVSLADVTSKCSSKSIHSPRSVQVSQ